MNSENSDQQYREQVLKQHEEIIGFQRATLELIRNSEAAVSASLDNMRLALMSALKVPIAVAMIGSVSWLFSERRIEEQTWVIFCLVSLFPWFGDSIRIVIDLIRGGTTREKVSGAVKLLLFAGAVAALLLPGCAAVPVARTYSFSYEGAAASVRFEPPVRASAPEGPPWVLHHEGKTIRPASSP